MTLTNRELWTVLHGMVFGAVFLLAFAGGFAGLWSLRPELVTEAGIKERVRRLVIGTWTMAIMAWLTVISGTYIVYPWYRAPVPDSPRSLLIADAALQAWHTFGMEWKEHVAWFSPILATTAAFLATTYGSKMTQKAHIRRATLMLFTLSFVAAAIAGVFGAFINKVGPIR